MNAHSESLRHAAKVLAFVVGSSILPLIVTMWTSNPSWLAFAPVINALAAYLVKYSQIQNSS